MGGHRAMNVPQKTGTNVHVVPGIDLFPTCVHRFSASCASTMPLHIGERGSIYHAWHSRQQRAVYMLEEWLLQNWLGLTDLLMIHGDYKH